MLMSGSQRMLTTLATALKATTSGAIANDNGSTSTVSTNDVATKQPMPVTTTTSTTETTEATMVSMEGAGSGISTVPTSRELLCAVRGGGGGVGGFTNEVACGEISGNPKTPTASAGVTAETSFYTNVIGNCNGRKNNSNPSNDNKCYSNNNNNNVNTKTVNNAVLRQQQQQQQQLLLHQELVQQQQQNHQQIELNVPVTGPGPGRPPSACSPNRLLHPPMYCGDRLPALCDFNMNVAGNNVGYGDDGGSGGGGNACSITAIFNAHNTNSNSNNNSNSYVDHNGNSHLTNCLNGNNANTNKTNNTNSILLALQQKQLLQQHQQQLQLNFATHMQAQFTSEDNSPCHTPPPMAAMRNIVNSNNNNNNNNNNNKCDSLSTAAAALGLPVALSLPLSLPLSLHLPLSASGSATPSSSSLSSSATASNCRTVTASDAAAMQCAYCCQPICDRYIMRVVDTSFHEGCLKCTTCALHLVHSCYARDGKLYCRIDYERLFLRNRCLGCGHRIACDELVMRTYDNVFHLKCFACVVCGGMLKKGEQYVVKQGQLFCRLDYEKEVEMLQGYDFYGDDLFAPKMDGRRGPKRPRTILNTQQRRAFKASFELSPKPCRKVRENLAKETGLSLRIVQVWFQNQRAKVKKIQKKAKQEHTKGASDSQDSQESDNSNLAKIKDEAHSDSESLLDSPFSACAGSVGGGSGVGGGVMSSCSDGAVKMRAIKDENENTSFNCMETNKENCNKTNEPFLSTVLGLSYSTFQQLMGPLTQSPMVNPIDRLYSMQNSYFRPDELSYEGCSKDLVEP